MSNRLTAALWMLSACIIPAAVCCGAGQTPSQNAPKPKVVTQGKVQTEKKVNSAPSKIRAASMQIVDGDQVRFYGLAGISGSMNPQTSTAELPCVWIIRSISARNAAAAKSLGIIPGNSYLQLKNGGRFTALGILKAGASMQIIKSIDPTATDEQLFEEYKHLLSVYAPEEKWIPATGEELVAAIKKGNKDTSDLFYTDCFVTDDLAESKSPQAVEIFLAAFKDPDPYVRRCVVGAISFIQDPRVVEPLISVINDNEWKVREMAINGLKFQKDPRAVDALIDTLKDKSVRNLVIRALGAIKDSRAVEPLIAMLKNEEYRNSMEDIINALGEIGDPRSIQPIENATRYMSSWDNRKTAARLAIKKITGTQQPK
jgi:hypothetical protein